MSMTQFAMVEELASLIKDNLSCKHLILSVEETLVDFLENDTSPDGILELEPMSSYNRLLLHRLADIFGFSHESIGEGDDRHLIFERCPESAIPSILVSDMLWQCDEYHSPVTSHQLLRRKEALPVVKEKPKSLGLTLEEREAAYLAARQRIFSVDNDEIKESVPPKPRNDPVVARRMIAHALGQRICSNSPNKDPNLPNRNKERDEKETPSISSQRISNNMPSSTSKGKRSVKKKHFNNKMPNNTGVQSDIAEKIYSKENIKQEHMGAAKRMFAHALGLQGMK
ncbi:hypothetical protein ACHQM5_028080 [Ranunculus cassubicifolius]